MCFSYEKHTNLKNQDHLQTYIIDYIKIRIDSTGGNM
jgi:hypothetical protein